MAQHMLTTVDNPWNPFTHYDEWQEFDESAGYYTIQYLARLTFSSDELSDADQDLAIEYAVEEAAALNINGMYRKVEAPDDYNADEFYTAAS